jgi:hypothetical protein
MCDGRGQFCVCAKACQFLFLLCLFWANLLRPFNATLIQVRFTISLESAYALCAVEIWLNLLILHTL